MDNGVPAILCDLTNVLRYGDICVLGSSDPLIIEVKSSNSKDKRGKRQKKNLLRLERFFKTDSAENYRGFAGTTLRVESTGNPETFSNMLADSIEKARSCGSDVLEVDGCLRFLVATSDEINYEEFLADVSKDHLFLNDLNSFKNQMNWGCYYPYALTLKDTSHFAKFVEGKLIIISAFDFKSFEECCEADSHRLSIEIIDGNIQCHLSACATNGNSAPSDFIIGDHIMCRMWMDFIRPKWIVENAIHMSTTFLARKELFE